MSTISQLTSAFETKLNTNVNDRERFGSVAVGTGILAGLLLGHGMSRLLMYAAAGALVYRGMTGHCHLYEKLGVDTEHSPRKPSGEITETAPVISL